LMPPVVQLTNFSLSVGHTQLLDGVTCQLSQGQRVALVGPNGCGKSTLLRALRGQGGPDPEHPEHDPYFVVGAGELTLSDDLCDDAQRATLLVDQDVQQWTRLLHVADLDYGEEDLRCMTVPDALEMATASGDASALEDLEAWRRLSVAADEALEWRTARYDDTPIAQLSPGSALRAYLAIGLMRQDIKLLLLDEPTNHLDLPSILWLQESILASSKTVVMVSHDTAFMDAVADHVWDIDATKQTITVSGVAFSEFRHHKELAVDQQRRAYDAQQKRHKRLTEVADNLRAAAASGERHEASDHDLFQRGFKRNRAGRSGKKAKAVESLRDSEPLVERVVDHVPLQIAIDFVDAGSQSSILLDRVSLGYRDRALPLPPISLRIDFGERVAIVGYNGVGKSTLLKTITKAMEPLNGDVNVGRELHFGNLTQEHESMPRSQSTRQYFAEATGIDPHRSGMRLIRYGLTLQQVDAQIGELNPGARARALLATFSKRKVNTLILDEPSNHLDEEAMREVSATLSEFKGSAIVVSHCRDFLESVEWTRMLVLSTRGLVEIESFESFVSATEQSVAAVVSACAR